MVIEVFVAHAAVEVLDEAEFAVAIGGPSVEGASAEFAALVAGLPLGGAARRNYDFEGGA